MQNLNELTIFVTKFRALGDSIMGLSAIQFLKYTYPNAKIIYGVPKWISPLFKNVQTSADSIHGYELRSIDDILSLANFLMNEKVDIVYEMNQSGRTSKFFNLYKWLSYSNYFYFNHHKEYRGVDFDERRNVPNIKRDLDGIAKHFQIEGPVEHLKFAPQISTSAPKRKKDFIVLGVIATRQTKMWPLYSYAELARFLAEKYQDTDILIPLSKSYDDEAIKQKLTDFGLPASAKFIQEPLETLPLTLSGAKLYIGNDTGLKHLSLALGSPTYTFFGPENPLEWHPYDQSQHPYYFVEDLSCRTEFAHFCGLNTCDSMICLNNIRAREVLENVSSILNK